VFAGLLTVNDIQLDSNSTHYILGWSFKLNGEDAALNYSALSLNTIHAAKTRQYILA
jgi:hypothetical protein